MSQWGNKDLANNIPSYLNSNHPGNTNVYLVSAGRLANASFGNSTNHAVAHQGWVKITKGTGYISSIAASNVSSKVYSNVFLTISGANTTQANARLVVNGTNTVSVVVNNPGAGYTTAPTITATGANNTTLVFTATMGGRANRVQAETLVVLSNTAVSNANSGLPYFTGV